MATIKFGSIITELKGLIGGHIYQGGKAGQIVRNKPSNRILFTTPTRHLNLVLIQNVLGYVASNWKNLTAIQQGTFGTFAASYPFLDKYGNSYTGSAYQVYLKLNIPLYRYNTTLITTCIAPVSAPPNTISSATAVAGGDITLNMSAVVPANFIMLVFATSNQSFGRASFTGNGLFVQQFAAGTGTAYVITDAFKKLYGAWYAGQKMQITVNFLSLTTGNLQDKSSIVITST